jgi:hypothetical protein
MQDVPPPPIAEEDADLFKALSESVAEMNLGMVEKIPEMTAAGTVGPSLLETVEIEKDDGGVEPPLIENHGDKGTLEPPLIENDDHATNEPALIKNEDGSIPMSPTFECEQGNESMGISEAPLSSNINGSIDNYTTQEDQSSSSPNLISVPSPEPLQEEFLLENLPYGGDMLAAIRNQDRESIKVLMRARWPSLPSLLFTFLLGRLPVSYFQHRMIPQSSSLTHLSDTFLPDKILTLLKV